MLNTSFDGSRPLPGQPFVSFIITDYNLPVGMLRDCVNSILALSLRQDEREIILVDDGSDSTPIEELSDLRRHLIYIRQDNRGLSAARNAGLRMATGQYIQFVDGDDMLLRAPYEHCLDIVRYHQPDMVLFQSTDRQEAETPFTFDGPMSGSRYMHGNNLRAAAWGYIFRSAMLGGLLFNEFLRMHEDEEFTPLLMLRADRLFTTDARAYFYRKRKGSITNSEKIEHKVLRLRYTEKVIYDLQDVLDMLTEQDRLALKRRISQLTMDYLYNIMRLTHDGSVMEAAVNRLKARGLFPLPDKDYTKKYRLFRKVMGNKLLRRLATTAMIG